MRNDNGIEFAIGDWLEIRKRFFASQFRVHPAIEHEPLARSFEVITIGADFDAPRQVNEFQFVPLLLLLLLLQRQQARIILVDASIETGDQTHEHGNDFQ